MEKSTNPFTRRTISFGYKHYELDPEVCRKMPIIGVQYDCLIAVPLFELRPRPIKVIRSTSRAQSISHRSAIDKGKGEVPLQH